jgi:hypothetical protein
MRSPLSQRPHPLSAAARAAALLLTAPLVASAQPMPSGMTRPASRPAGPATAPAAADPLATVVTSHPLTAAERRLREQHGFGIAENDSALSVTFPAELKAAVEAVAPSFRVRDGMPVPGVPGTASLGFGRSTPGALLADFDRNGRLDLVLVGDLASRERITVDTQVVYGQGSVGERGPVKTRRQAVLILGVQSKPTAAGTPPAYDVKVLHRAQEEHALSADGSPAYDVEQLSGLLTSGKRELYQPTAAQLRTGTRIARYQDGDCKGPGVQWTLRAGVWVRAKSPCTYGE